MTYHIDLHTHTLVSHHAYSTIHDYIRYAKENGIVMFANTDHGPGVSDATHPWHFNNLKVLPRVPEGVAVLRGIEANLCKDGSLGIDPYYLDKLDIVLAGFHPNLEPSDSDTHTEILIKAMQSGRMDIVSHSGNSKYPVDYEAVLECAKQCNVAVEINASSSVNTRYGSHENCVTVARLAKKIGNTISLGTDAHISYFLGNFDEAENVMREAGLDDTHVINTSPNKVLDFLESRGHKSIPEMREFFKGC